MIAYKDIVQGTPEWHELRWGKIGGTLAKGLFVKSDTLLIDLLSQYLEEFEPSDEFESKDMQRGKEMEPFAFEYICKYTNIAFEKFGWLQSEENELLGISPDGLTEDFKIALEIKCFGRKKHTEVLLENEIPLDNIHQIVHYFTVNPNLEKLIFIAFRPESLKHFVKELTKDSLVNIGTNARPVMKKIAEASKMAKDSADELLLKIKDSKAKLEF